MREIELTQGKVALVDDEAYEMLMRWKWYAFTTSPNKAVWYAGRKGALFNGNRGCIRMHRVILGVTDPKVLVDHRNHDGLDNRRENIRICPDGENPQNARKWITPTTSRYRGVCWDKRSKKWYVQIWADGTRKCLGRFASEDDAGEAYNRAAEYYFGEFAHLNVIQR